MEMEAKSRQNAPPIPSLNILLIINLRNKCYIKEFTRRFRLDSSREVTKEISFLMQKLGLPMIK